MTQPTAAQNANPRWLPVAGLLLMLSGILAFAPLAPILPKVGLDDSWRLAMNQAVAQGLVFGRDIVFTFGPYSAVYTHHYHPFTYAPNLTLGVLLGGGYGAMLLMLLRQRGNGWVWCSAGVLLLANSRDTLFFAYPLLAALVACAETLPRLASADRLCFPARNTAYALAVALLGALPIIKGSFLPLTLMAMTVGAILYWRDGNRPFAALFIVLPVLAMAALWLLAGQPLAALPDYFRTMAPIISGFAGAMGLWGPPGQISLYLLIVVGVLFSLLQARGESKLHRLACVVMVGSFLFIVFKAGFVRHDGHASAAGSGALLGIFAINGSRIIRIFWPTLVLALLTFVLIHVWWLAFPYREPSVVESLRKLAQGDAVGMESAYTQRLAQISAQWPLPGFPGSVDIYPFDQVQLIASGNLWHSRPVLQSYSAYTPALARLNAAHLRGPRAPDNILFRVGSIDGHLPALDDGLSWPRLLSDYQLSGAISDHVHLTRRPTPAAVTRTVIAQERHRLGEWVELPSVPQILFAEVDLRPTLLGRLATALFKPDMTYIAVATSDGKSRLYRFIPSTARAGFVISPLIESNIEFAQFADRQLPALLEHKRVAAIQIVTVSTRFECRDVLWIICDRKNLQIDKGVSSPFWRSDYELKLTALQPDKKVTAE
ncbi:MAG: hypothetical protein AMXMBFR26_14910 [Porticoccaceae bacterium]